MCLPSYLVCVGHVTPRVAGNKLKLIVNVRENVLFQRTRLQNGWATNRLHAMSVGGDYNTYPSNITIITSITLESTAAVQPVRDNEHNKLLEPMRWRHT